MSFQFDPERLKDLWFSSETNAVIARSLGLSHWQLYVAGQRLGLPPRYGCVQRVWKTEDWSPETIAERAAEIRAGWSDEERDRRAAGSGGRKWKMPSYVYDGREATFKHQPVSP